VREGLNWRTKIIQPRWAMEEYARILRNWVWLSPPHPPTTVEVRPKKIRRAGASELSCVMSAKGASFCQVERISPVVRSRPWRTSGSQKWVGASPTFSARAMVTAVVVSG